MNFFVRAGHNDNRLLEELTAPASAGIHLGQQVPFHGIVVNAQTAVSRPAISDTVRAAGLPLMIDPLTPLLQTVQSPNHPWATLPFASADAMDPSDMALGSIQDELIELTIQFQIDQGATILIPPYFYAKELNDPWFQIQLSINRRAAAYLAHENIPLQVAPILAANLRKFGVQAFWPGGVDKYMGSISDMDVRHVAVALSASRSSKGDTEDRLSTYLSTISHLSSSENIVAWRQGQYGLAAVAAGAVGYQTGPGIGERCDFPELARNQRPKPSGAKRPGSSKYIYLPLFGRSFPKSTATTLLESQHLKGILTCLDARCCPDGATSMISDWRQHALHSRARQFRELHAMPNMSWRLNSIAAQADRAASAARVANQVLTDAGIAQRLPERSFRSLASVTEAMRQAVATGSNIA